VASCEDPALNTQPHLCHQLHTIHPCQSQGRWVHGGWKRTCMCQCLRDEREKGRRRLCLVVWHSVPSLVVHLSAYSSWVRIRAARPAASGDLSLRCMSLTSVHTKKVCKSACQCTAHQTSALHTRAAACGTVRGMRLAWLHVWLQYCSSAGGVTCSTPDKVHRSSPVVAVVKGYCGMVWCCMVDSVMSCTCAQHRCGICHHEPQGMFQLGLLRLSWQSGCSQ